MIRNIVGVIAAYAIFVVSSLALFKLSGQNPHGQTPFTFQLLTAVYGAVFSFLAGFVLQLMAKSKSLRLNYVLAFIVAGFALFLLLRAEGSHWAQILAITIFVPVSILGGLFYLNRRTR